MKRTVLGLVGIALLTAILAGCGEEKPKGYEKKDFEKRPPPPGYLNNVPKAPSAPPGPPGGAQGGQGNAQGQGEQKAPNAAQGQ